MYVKFGIFVWISLFLSGGMLYAMEKEDVDKLIANIEKASDPENIKATIKTQESKLEITIPDQKIKFNITILDKYPDKSKTISEIPGVMTNYKVVNGDIAWESSPSMGLRDIKGDELLALKLDMDLKNPSKTMRDVFGKIDVADKTEKIDEFECYKLTCTPKKEYNSKPITLFVDKKTFFLRKMIMDLVTKMGDVKSEMRFYDYKQVNKIFMPMKTIVKQMQMEMNANVVEIKNNIKVNDSEFEKPKSCGSNK